MIVRRKVGGGRNVQLVRVVGVSRRFEGREAKVVGVAESPVRVDPMPVLLISNSISMRSERKGEGENALQAKSSKPRPFPPPSP